MDGQFVTITGGNGVDKSMFMKLLSGNIRSGKGKVVIDNSDVTKMFPENISYIASRVFQHTITMMFADLTIEENMSLTMKYGESRELR